jgi:hypothetical protein
MSFFRKPTPLPVQQGGTGDQNFSSGYALIGNGYGALLELTPSTTGNVMTSNGTTWTSAPPSGGGSGTVNSGTAYQLAYYAASGTAVSTLGSLGTSGQVLTSGGAGVAPSWTTVSGGGTQATATALGTVYAKQTTGGGTPYLTAFGYNAGVSTTGVGTTAIGVEALYTNSTGARNTAMGYRAGYSNTGDNNLFIGDQSGFTNTTGTANSFVSGMDTNNWPSGYYNTTGSENSGFGGGTLKSNTTGSQNTAIGIDALFLNTTGTSNTAVGYNALKSNLNDGNTAVGVSSLTSVASTGRYNTAIGTASGQVIVDGYGGVYLGGYTSASGTSPTYELVVGYGATGKGSSTGFIDPHGGAVYQGNNSATWSITSDQRLKKNIVDNTIGLEAINQIQVRNFEYRTEDEVTDLPKNQVIKKEGVQLGVIAQELQEILPDCIKEESTGVLSVNSENITWHLVNAIKELSAELNVLKAKVGI